MRLPLPYFFKISSLYCRTYYDLNYHLFKHVIFCKILHVAGEVLVFYLPIRFFYYLANLIIFTRSSRIPCILFLVGGFKGIYLREKNCTLSYVISEI